MAALAARGQQPPAGGMPPMPPQMPPPQVSMRGASAIPPGAQLIPQLSGPVDPNAPPPGGGQGPMQPQLPTSPTDWAGMLGLPQSPLAPYSPQLGNQTPDRASSWNDDPFIAQLMQNAPKYPVNPPLKDSEKPGYHPKPDMALVRSAIELDKTNNSLLIQRMSRDVAIFRQDTSGVPADFNKDRDHAVPSSAMSTLVNKLSGMFAGATETYEVPYANTPQEKSAQAIENYLYRARKIRKVRYARNGGADLQRDEFFYLLLHGRYVTRILPNLDDDLFPFSIDLLDPATCFPTYGTEREGMIRMTRRYSTTVGQVLSEFGGVNPQLRQQLRDKLGIRNEGEATFNNQIGEFREYTDSWWRWAEFMGVEVLPLTDHKFGFVPYVEVMATGEPKTMATPGGTYWSTGDGGQYTNLLVGSDKDIAEKGVSVFHYLINTHKVREALMTLLLIEVEKAANPPTITYTAPHLIDEDVPPLRTGRGGNNKRMLNVQQVEGLPTSPRPTDFSPLMNHIDQEFVDGSVNPAAMGNVPGSNISGLALDSLMGSIRDMTLPYEKSWAHGQSLIAEQMLYHLRDRILPIQVLDDPGDDVDNGDQLSAQQIKDVGCYVEVKLDEVGPDTKMQRVATANQAVTAGLMSQRTGIEFIGTKDPDAEFSQIVAEKAMQHPMIMENFIIPSGFIARGEPELAKMWSMLVTGPKLQQILAGQGGDQGGGAGGAGMPPGMQQPSPAGPMQQSNPVQGVPTPPPGGPAPGQGRGPAPTQ